MYKIILSLTAHENIKCLYDLIDNIKKAFKNYDILILLSLTQSLYNVFNNIYDFVKIVTNRPDNLRIHTNINLFYQHILNMKYIYENNIKYDYFWFVASNEMFIKIIPPDFIDVYGLKIIDEKKPINDIDYNIYYHKFIKDSLKCVHLSKCIKDTHFIDYLYKNKFILYWHQHEGLVLESSLVLKIFNEYNENKLYEKAVFNDYFMEEFFMSTYILNKYNIYNNMIEFCFRYNESIKIKRGETINYERIEKHLLNSHVSIKPVKRRYKDPLRTLIRNKI